MTERPCDTEDHDNVTPMPARPSAKIIRLPVKVFGSDVRDAQINNDLCMEIARLARSADAAPYDPLDGNDGSAA